MIKYKIKINKKLKNILIENKNKGRKIKIKKIFYGIN